MRISKLFHWLYASIMLMPIFAIGVKSLYVTFNPNSKDSYSGNYQPNYEIIIPERYINGNEYEFTNYNDITNSLEIYLSNVSNITTSMSTSLQTSLSNATVFVIYRNSVNQQLSLRIVWDNNGVETTNYYDLTNQTLNFDFTFLSYVGSLTDMNNFVYERYAITNTMIDNVFYYSVEQISNESFFNWANGTFLAQPLLFITNLFGVPSTSPIITILCYWFAISVIWLVFDVIMYIPLLVHRWLDKGVIE